MQVKLNLLPKKPKINTLCLVFYKDPNMYPDICDYLDDTNIEVEQFGEGEGFYVRSDPVSDGPVNMDWIRGWVDLYKIDKCLKDACQIIDDIQNK